METLNMKIRESSTDTNGLREDGWIPAVYYGRDTDSTSIAVSLADFVHLYHEVGESTVFSLVSEDESGESREALIHDMDIHPVTGEPLHVDFYIIAEGQTVTVSVPLVFAGESPAVKNLGGTLVRVVRELEVEAEPRKLPPEIEIDISGLEEFGDHITVEDLNLPDGVEASMESDATIALIEEPTEEEELEPEEEMDLDDIEVAGEAREDEEGGEEPIEGGEQSEAGAETEE